MFNLKGSIAALVTPMDSDGEINWEGLEELIQWHIRSNTSGLVIVGTTGESATLDVAEHVQCHQGRCGAACTASYAESRARVQARRAP